MKTLIMSSTIILLLGANQSFAQGLNSSTTTRPASQWEAFGAPAGWSCATAWQRDNEFGSTAYALGFWTGLNVQGKQSVGNATDGAGIIAEIKLKCSQQPSMNFLSAVVDTYVDMALK